MLLISKLTIDAVEMVRSKAVNPFAGLGKFWLTEYSLIIFTVLIPTGQNVDVASERYPVETSCTETAADAMLDPAWVEVW